MSNPVRSLEHLENTASTARVLNLRALAKRHARNPEYIAKPLFRNTTLNTSIILKHRLRAHEQSDFNEPRNSATKIMLPIEVGDLRMGARYVFVGQRNFAELMYSSLGIVVAESNDDIRTLMILDQTPSLDPFLLREQLKRRGIDAAACYFEISEADVTRMLDFAQKEIQQLVAMSVGDDALSGHAARLAHKLLMKSSDAALEPLRLTLQLSDQQYQEGIFCWKAFLYYKWRLTQVLPQINSIMTEIAQIKPSGGVDIEMRAYLTETREVIRKQVVESCRRVRDTLGIYDEAYGAMTQGDPLRFRDFLLKAPALFNDLGERLAAVDHIISFWRYRFPDARVKRINPDELVDIFSDFEQSLAFQPRDKAAA